MPNNSQLVPNMEKHSAKREPGTVPPRELGIVPLLGGKNAPLMCTENSSPVVQFLALISLVAALKTELRTPRPATGVSRAEGVSDGVSPKPFGPRALRETPVAGWGVLQVQRKFFDWKRCIS